MPLISFADIELRFNSYIIPFLTALNIINNVILLLFFFQNRTIQRSLPKTVCLNYIAMAVNDINNSIYMQISHFLGTAVINVQITNVLEN